MALIWRMGEGAGKIRNQKFEKGAARQADDTFSGAVIGFAGILRATRANISNF